MTESVLSLKNVVKFYPGSHGRSNASFGCVSQPRFGRQIRARIIYE